MPRYVLPDLDYDFSALEPHISAQIMELHHDKHHAAYVKNANATLEKIDETRGKGDLSSLAALERALAFNLSGHVLHSLFWKNMKPKGGGEPAGALAEAVRRDFGGFDGLKRQLTEASSTIMGSGWGALVYEPIAQRLLTCQVYDHQSNVTQSGVPLLVIDAWEHAFYLQYKSDKASFVKAVWNTFDWDDVAARYEAARKLDARLPKAVEAGAK